MKRPRACKQSSFTIAGWRVLISSSYRNKSFENKTTKKRFTSLSSFNCELLFVTIGWRRSGFDLIVVVPVKPHVFERDNDEFCFNEARDCVRVVGVLPDEHRLLFDDIEISI